ncbi:calcium-binding protein [Corchorus capsularis]|uniref:Calcium-binding protein n=1 Tax=Corchorus capsularis TaxID=210143 RepID=A0A1R3GT52_COCAP|nr:calcium-binding protein [Corchorus capsularis]
MALSSMVALPSSSNPLHPGFYPGDLPGPSSVYPGGVPSTALSSMVSLPSSSNPHHPPPPMFEFYSGGHPGVYPPMGGVPSTTSSSMVVHSAINTFQDILFIMCSVWLPH